MIVEFVINRINNNRYQNHESDKNMFLFIYTFSCNTYNKHVYKISKVGKILIQEHAFSIYKRIS